MGKVLFIVLFSLLFAGCVLWDDIDTLRERARGREEPEIELDYSEEGEEEVSEGEEEEQPPSPELNITIEMVFVPGGSFELGREIGTDGEGDETPVSTVTLTGFHIGKYEVTQEQYQAVMGTNPSYFSSNPAAGETQGRRPVERVSWYDAIIFCNRLSMIEGLTPAYRINGSTDPAVWGAVPTAWLDPLIIVWDAVEIVAGSTGYRLPTEAQWEYAAKGGNNPPVGYTYSGSNNADEVAWYSSNSGNRTHEVGRLAPNSLGIYDMSGNVWEWCWDWCENDWLGVGVPSGSDRVLRGGNWYNDNIRSVLRGSIFVPNLRDDRVGFRLVRP